MDTGSFQTVIIKGVDNDIVRSAQGAQLLPVQALLLPFQQPSTVYDSSLVRLVYCGTNRSLLQVVGLLHTIATPVVSIIREWRMMSYSSCGVDAW